MARNTSFMLAENQIRARTKTVTRRGRWLFLKVGDPLTAVEQNQGLKKGQKVKRLCSIRVVSLRREPLAAITPEDCIKEGFPEMTPEDFISFYTGHNKIKPEDEITRIEFEYLD